ncbi:MAG: acetyl-CoA carboxylase biotin carboxyl carrier protein subunit [Bacteroidota bacterium]|nr:acetyl-CoA carboxylase biotin carboxyl carrier protein subunit [Odoribacter sp.]MDP3645319.1 acetyl-CoA carboxylase biotin carboxyl carrier protein subunit [Bacteroidota bacterium]
MSIEIRLDKRIASVEILKQYENLLEIKVDDKIYQVDLMHNDEGIFSILNKGRSYNIELVPQTNPKLYTAYTLYDNYDIEIIDAESRYLRNRSGSTQLISENTISSPMPGKVVKIPVSVGDEVKKGDTVITISAMKMESEYKSPIDGKIVIIHVTEGSTIDANQKLIEIE